MDDYGKKYEFNYNDSKTRMKKIFCLSIICCVATLLVSCRNYIPAEEHIICEMHEESFDAITERSHAIYAETTEGQTEAGIEKEINEAHGDRFTITKQINEEMPPFTFHIQLAAEQIMHEYYFHLMHEYHFHPMYETAILITDHQGELIQHIDGLFRCASVIHWHGLRFSDLNVNGYMDMYLKKIQDGLSGTGTHYVWLWDVGNRQFVLHEQLMEIVRYNLSFSGELGTEGLLTVSHFFRMNAWAFSDYSYENGKFTRVSHTAGQYIFDHATLAWYTHVETSDLITGERTIEKEEIDIWGAGILDSDRRIVEKVDIGHGEPLLFRFDQWEVDEFAYRLIITVFNQFGDLLQQIDGLYQTTSPWTPIEDEATQPTFVDLNFDGFLDLRIWRDFHSERGDGWASHYHFVWESGQFVQNKEFDVLISVRIIPDEENQTWSYGWQEQAGARQVKETFGFVDGAFVHVGTDDTMHRKIRDGEWDSGWLAIRDVITFHPFTRHITIYDATDLAEHGQEPTPIQDLGHFQQEGNLIFWWDFNDDGYLDLALGEYVRWVWCQDERLFVIWEDLLMG